MCETCVEYKNFMAVQKKIILRHREKHAWFRHIENKTDATLSFISDYAFLIREIYCELCPQKENCKIYQKMIDNTPKI